MKKRLNSFLGLAAVLVALVPSVQAAEIFQFQIEKDLIWKPKVKAEHPKSKPPALLGDNVLIPSSPDEQLENRLRVERHWSLRNFLRTIVRIDGQSRHCHRAETVARALTSDSIVLEELRNLRPRGEACISYVTSQIDKMAADMADEQRLLATYSQACSRYVANFFDLESSALHSEREVCRAYRGTWPNDLPYLEEYSVKLFNKRLNDFSRVGTGWDYLAYQQQRCDINANTPDPREPPNARNLSCEEAQEAAQEAAIGFNSQQAACDALAQHPGTWAIGAYWRMRDIDHEGDSPCGDLFEPVIERYGGLYLSQDADWLAHFRRCSGGESRQTLVETRAVMERAADIAGTACNARK